jgi:hypothetical protein
MQPPEQQGEDHREGGGEGGPAEMARETTHSSKKQNDVEQTGTFH